MFMAGSQNPPMLRETMSSMNSSAAALHSGPPTAATRVERSRFFRAEIRFEA